jgi:hypothetical protein
MPGIDALERFVNSLESELRLAVNDTLHAGFNLAVQASSGTLTEADLIARDHPYALRHGTPQEDPDVINVRSGAFRAGWRVSGPFTISGGYGGTIENIDPKADELKRGLVNGRHLMFSRSPDEKVAVELQPIFEANIMRAIVRAAR